MLKKIAALGFVTLSTAALAACAGDVPMEAAPAANEPLCAQVTVRLPEAVAGFEKRGTNAQATGAWGVPASVLLRCGLPVSEPTTDACINVNGIDWVVDETQAPLYRFEAYGREPGLEIFVDSEALSGTDALLELSNAVQQLPQVRQCTSVSDTLDQSQFNADS